MSAFSLPGRLAKILALVFALLPGGVAAGLLFVPHMPDIRAMYGSAGPLGVVFIARPIISMGMVFSLPLALALSFLPPKKSWGAVFFLYLILGMAAAWRGA